MPLGDVGMQYPFPYKTTDGEVDSGGDDAVTTLTVAGTSTFGGTVTMNGALVVNGSTSADTWTASTSLAGIASSSQTNVSLSAAAAAEYKVVNDSASSIRLGVYGSGYPGLANTSYLIANTGDFFVNVPTTKNITFKTNNLNRLVITDASTTIDNQLIIGTPLAVTYGGTGGTTSTGTGAVVLATTPTLVTPNIGAATGTSLTVTGQLVSTVAGGTAPLVVNSATNVVNLNAAYLNGATFSAPNPIGSDTPTTGAFTALSTTGQFTSTLATGTAPFVVASSTKVSNLSANSLDGYTFVNPGNIGTTVSYIGSFTQVNASTGYGGKAALSSAGNLGQFIGTTLTTATDAVSYGTTSTTVPGSSFTTVLTFASVTAGNYIYSYDMYYQSNNNTGFYSKLQAGGVDCTPWQFFQPPANTMYGLKTAFGCLRVINTTTITLQSYYVGGGAPADAGNSMVMVRVG